MTLTLIRLNHWNWYKSASLTEIIIEQSLKSLTKSFRKQECSSFCHGLPDCQTKGRTITLTLFFYVNQKVQPLHSPAKNKTTKRERERDRERERERKMQMYKLLQIIPQKKQIQQQQQQKARTAQSWPSNCKQKNYATFSHNNSSTCECVRVKHSLPVSAWQVNRGPCHWYGCQNHSTRIPQWTADNLQWQ